MLYLYDCNHINHTFKNQNYHGKNTGTLKCISYIHIASTFVMLPKI